MAPIFHQSRDDTMGEFSLYRNLKYTIPDYIDVQYGLSPFQMKILVFTCFWIPSPCHLVPSTTQEVKSNNNSAINQGATKYCKGAQMCHPTGTKTLSGVNHRWSGSTFGQTTYNMCGL